MSGWHKQARLLLTTLLAMVLVLSLASCGNKAATQEIPGVYTETASVSKQNKDISETSPPEVIQQLGEILEKYQPQVEITSPQAEQLFTDNTVSVSFQVRDLPLFQNSQLLLGPHLQVILDNQPYTEIYDLNQPLELKDLTAGTHTLRVFAVRPWGESFKNDGAYAQTTFHIFTKTDDNNPDRKQPLLTYNSPTGTYGAEPILLDFYLTNAPLHFVASQNPNDQIADWRIRCTINDESFVLDRWQSLYLKGFKLGKNWVKLEFLDEKGNPVKNVFNTTASIVTYDPKAKDTLSQIIKGKFSFADVRGIVEPQYIPPAPTTEPQVEETQPQQPEEEENELPAVEITPTPAPQPELTPTVEPTSQPEAETTPQLEPQPEVTPTVTPTSEPEAEFTLPSKTKRRPFFKDRRLPVVEPVPEVIESPAVEATPEVVPPTPEVIESPAVEATPDVEMTPVPEVVPAPESIPTTQLQQPVMKRLSGYFQRRPRRE